MIVGIDLGTTNSLIAGVNHGGAQLFVGEDGNSLIPSIVHFPKNGPPVVGCHAKPFKGLSPEDTLYSVKRLLGQGKMDRPFDQFPFDLTASDDKNIRMRVHGKIYSPVEISALILAKLKSIAESQSGKAIRQAVVTVPAHFNDTQRQETRRAGELAGLEVMRIINEPTAACLAYGLNHKTEGTVAVYDLGGGTFDVSILRIKDGVFEVLATNGNTALGGDDFDLAIAEALHLLILKELGVDLFGKPQTKSLLLIAAEGLKKQFSSASEVTWTHSVSGRIYKRVISSMEFQNWIQPILDTTKVPVFSCLKDAKLSKDQLTDVILVGGSTRSPLVAQYVAELLGRTPICSINPDEVVAIGAAVQARILEGKLEGMLLLDVTPLSLGIETVGGVFEKLIHRNSTIPVSASQQFTTSVDGQTSVDIHVLQGEREMVKDNRSLARFQLSGIPPMAAGLPKVEVEFIIDANGILSVNALERRSGRTSKITVNPTYGLSDTDVENQLSASYENAETDFKARFLAEAVTEGRALIQATKKSVKAGEGLLETVEKASIHQAMENLEKSLVIVDHSFVRQKIEALNQATQGFAERLLNSSVSNALKEKNVKIGKATGGPHEVD